MKQIKNLIAFCAGVSLLVSSCSSSKDISYFQDLTPGKENVLPLLTPIKLQPDDKITIIVSTSDARLNSLYNLPVAETRLNNFDSTGKSTATYSGNITPYIIDSHGDINFPVLGKLHIAGMNREEVAEYIRRELISRDLAKNPIVTVDYLNLSVSVMGEVTNPGLYNFDSDNFTILEALSAAGDLTIYGKRNNVRVLREDNGMQKVYEVDLNSGDKITQSPVYYLKQNDVIYVEPNSTKARMSTPNGNSVLTPTFWISIASFATTIAVLIVK
ncbi:MAG: polysaccharide export protein [Bacteroides sp.]|nr:polysaccharide export protein [Bacteroides sp.]MBD5349098.1 polysaccharide export protein [Bacteroides sp.]